MDNRIGRYNFTVEPFSEDYTGRLTWESMGNHLLRCASLHAGRLGFGYDSMIRNRHVWVLSRLVVELNHMPRTWESYTLNTWISALYRQFTDRLYSITAPDGTAYGYAYTVWALIDMDTRQPLDLTCLPGEGLTGAVIADRPFPVKGPGRIRVKSRTAIRRRPTYYSDIDINGHVNSIRYIEMILDLFPKQTFDRFAPQRVELAYCSETYCGEELSFFIDQADPLCYHVEVRKADSTTAVRAAVRFRPLDLSQTDFPATLLAGEPSAAQRQ